MKKVFLVHRSGEKVDITDIYSSHTNKENGVRVSYHSFYVNGELVPYRHQTFHNFASICISDGRTLKLSTRKGKAKVATMKTLNDLWLYICKNTKNAYDYAQYYTANMNETAKAFWNGMLTVLEAEGKITKEDSLRIWYEIEPTEALKNYLNEFDKEANV